MNDAEKLYKKLTRVKYGSVSCQESKQEGYLEMFRKKADVVNYYEKKLKKLECDMRLKQSLLAREEVPAAFVSFKTRHGASIASNIQQGIDPTQWLTETAPEPEDVHWPFFTASFVEDGTLMRKIVSQVIMGYLPSLIFEVFLMIVQPIMLLLSSMQGFISHSQIFHSELLQQLWEFNTRLE